MVVLLAWPHQARHGQERDVRGPDGLPTLVDNRTVGRKATLSRKQIEAGKLSGTVKTTLEGVDPRAYRRHVGEIGA